VFAGAVSAGAQKVQEALATEQKAMTVRMLEEERQKFENTRQDKMIGAQAALAKAGQEFQAAEGEKTRLHVSGESGKTRAQSQEQFLDTKGLKLTELSDTKDYRALQEANNKTIAERGNQTQKDIHAENNKTSERVARISAAAHEKTATASTNATLLGELKDLRSDRRLLAKELTDVMADPKNPVNRALQSQFDQTDELIESTQALLHNKIGIAAPQPGAAITKGVAPLENYQKSLAAHPGRKADVDKAWTDAGYTIPNVSAPSAQTPVSPPVETGLLQDPAQFNRMGRGR
jgi:hypothetical protein